MREGLLEVRGLLLREHHRILLRVALEPEAERLGDERLHVVERDGGVPLEQLPHPALELSDGHRLVREAVHVERVARTCEAHGHSAGLVVSRDDDECVVGMLLLERERDLHGLVEREHVAQVRRGVVAVPGPVDASALRHHEEALLVVEHLYALRDHLGERRLRAVRVDGVVERPVRELREDLSVARP